MFLESSGFGGIFAEKCSETRNLECWEEIEISYQL